MASCVAAARPVLKSTVSAGIAPVAAASVASSGFQAKQAPVKVTPQRGAFRGLSLQIKPSTCINRAMAQPKVSAKFTQDELKQQAADKAVEYVKSGMILGLGTGSTAAFAVAKIGAKLKSGELKDIIAVPTSIRTYEQAKSLGIPLATLDEQPKLDLAIDGADEVDPDLNLVKGRGGALLREKMVEMASKQFVCIVDDTKLVKGLGGSGLAMPVEIVQFCWKYNAKRLQELPEVAGCTAKLRMEGDKPYVTDNSNYIVDLYFPAGKTIKDAVAAGNAIAALEGVVDHGLFLNMADVVIVAAPDGVYEMKKK